MVEVHIERLVRRIALTRDSEIDCGEAFHLSAGYVEAVVRGEGAAATWEFVRLHLEQCTVCAEEFSQLVRVVQMDLDGTWPSSNMLLDIWGASGLNA